MRDVPIIPYTISFGADAEARTAAARRQWTAIQEEERQRDAASGKIGTTEALEILEIEAGAPEQEIRAAHKRLMKRVIRMWVGRSIFPSN